FRLEYFLTTCVSGAATAPPPLIRTRRHYTSGEFAGLRRGVRRGPVSAARGPARPRGAALVARDQASDVAVLPGHNAGLNDVSTRRRGHVTSPTHGTVAAYSHARVH